MYARLGQEDLSIELSEPELGPAAAEGETHGFTIERVKIFAKLQVGLCIFVVNKRRNNISIMWNGIAPPSDEGQNGV